jgi:hypothetical protein
VDALAARDEVVFACGTHLQNCVYWVCGRGSPGDSFIWCIRLCLEFNKIL